MAQITNLETRETVQFGGADELAATLDQWYPTSDGWPVGTDNAKAGLVRAFRQHRYTAGYECLLGVRLR